MVDFIVINCIYCHSKFCCNNSSYAICQNHKNYIIYYKDLYQFDIHFKNGMFVCAINILYKKITICNDLLGKWQPIFKLDYLTYISPDTIDEQFEKWMLLQ
jgi:hypothetical protein